jgi:hypothetical protein
MQLDRLTKGMLIPFGGDRAVSVPAGLANEFRAGRHAGRMPDRRGVASYTGRYSQRSARRYFCVFGSLQGVGD